MARPLRIEYEGAWYHVMNRGAARKNIFNNDEHRNFFLMLLEQISCRYKIEIHGYCLMTNHYHILVRTPLANLHKCMRYLNSIYTQQFNRSKNIDGPLFRGRYKAILVSEEEYLLNVSRYIHLNPIEAKICKVPQDYCWSSCKYYYGKGKKPAWLHCKKILEDFESHEMSSASYHAFLTEGIDVKTADFYGSSKIPIFGSKDFISIVRGRHLKNKIIPREIPERKLLEKLFLPSVETIIQSVAKFYDVSIDKIKLTKKGVNNFPRAIAIFISVEHCQLSFQSLGAYFGNITQNGISNAYHRMLVRSKTENILKAEIENLIHILKQIDNKGNGAI